MPNLVERDDGVPSGYVEEDGYYVPWWYSRDGTIFKWCLFLIPAVLLLSWFIFGRIHATRRVKKGLPPLRYHRVLVPARYRPRPMGGPQGWPQQQPYYQQQPNGYGYPMGNMAPPPVYDPQRPPQYTEPAGTKVDPSQFMQTNRPGEGAGQYQPPPGPPPPPAAGR